MTRISWDRVSPDDIEEAVSMFLCRINPDAYRVRPSRGDNGIDVCVPKGDNHYDIYQVKRFAKNLTTNQKTQAASSHARVAQYADERHWTIDNWYLTMPLDPTPENLAWLTELETTRSFPCAWRGLTHIDGWAAEYPDVVDYYFEDGKTRLTEQLAQFVAISGIRILPGGNTAVSVQQFTEIEPADAINGLGQLRNRLNATDPHFTYDFSVTGEPPEQHGIFVSTTLIARTTREIDDNYITFDVYARCTESLNERPITIKITVDIDPNSPEGQQLADFHRYGRVPTIPITATNTQIDMPGGLGISDTPSQIRLHGYDTGEPFDRRLTILAPDDSPLASIEATLHPPLHNHDNTGQWNYGTDRSGLLHLETMVSTKDPDRFDIRFHRGDVTSHIADEIEQPLAFVDAFHYPNTLRIESIRGPKQAVLQRIPNYERDPDTISINKAYLRYSRALSRIQQHTTTTLKIPPHSKLIDLGIREAERVAALLDGETITGTWNRWVVGLPTNAPQLFDNSQIEAQIDLKLAVGTQTLDLGSVQIIFSRAQIADQSTQDDMTIYTLRPHPDNNAFHQRWLGGTHTKPPQID
ncbi:hypothetical protein [Rhodococcus sp. JG-3]|uniref:hypothetical protein n=1 Tax=Rhodococcus sp. JG-3 TaxID=1305835 RepID=UPI00041520C9|nr:hypothetical protein [Rhodococcus sp. JG-3]